MKNRSSLSNLSRDPLSKQSEPTRVMSTTNSNVEEGYKVCAYRECDRLGDIYLEVELIKRKGWFCNSCATDLKWHGIAREVEQ